MQYIYCWNSSFSKAHWALKGRGLRKEGRREQNIIIRSWIRPFSSSLLGYTYTHIHTRLCMKTARCIDFFKNKIIIFMLGPIIFKALQYFFHPEFVTHDMVTAQILVHQ